MDDNQSGAAYVTFGKREASTSVLSLSELEGANGFKNCLGIRGRSGISVSGGGDVNCDRFADMVIDAPTRSGGSGAAYLVSEASSRLQLQGADEAFTPGCGIISESIENELDPARESSPAFCATRASTATSIIKATKVDFDPTQHPTFSHAASALAAPSASRQPASATIRAGDGRRCEWPENSGH
jgi:hypothetical protein